MLIATGQQTATEGNEEQQASSAVPRTGIYRTLPHLTAGVDETATQAKAGSLHLTAEPNPARGEVHIAWQGDGLSGEARLSVHDVLGREVAVWDVAARQMATVWNSDGLVGGAYFIRLAIGNRSDTAQVIVK